jgi:hypothetical protein
MNMQYRSNIAFILTVGFLLWANACFAQPANIRITNNGSPQNEPMVAINPQNHDRLIAGFNDERTGNYRVGWAWSNDGGTIWNFGATFNPGGTTHPGVYTRGADPVVAFDTNGTAYMTWLAYNPDPNANILGRDGSIFIARSGDGGQTFNVFQKRIAQGNGTATYYDKPWLYVNPANNHVYVAWTKRTNAWGDGGAQSMVIEFVRSLYRWGCDLLEPRTGKHIQSSDRQLRLTRPADRGWPRQQRLCGLAHDRQRHPG